MKNRKGVAFIISLLIIVVLAALSAVMLSRGVFENRHMQRYVSGTNAFWMAEAGIQRGLWELNNGGGTWSGWTDVSGDKTFQGSLGSAGDFDITVINPASNNPQVLAVGYFPNRNAADMVSRSVDVRLNKTGSIFEYAAFGGTAITMSGQGEADSYDSSLGAYGGGNVDTNGDVGTNGDISISGGNAYVYGDASTGPAGTFNDPSKVSGAITHDNSVPLPLQAVPPTLASLPSSGTINNTVTINPGDYQYLSINLSSKKTVTIVGPTNIYLTGSTAVKVSGQAKVVIDPASTGPVNIYFDGDISLTGQGITNSTQTPSNLILYGTNPVVQDVKMAGQADFHGAIYAPTADLKLTGQGGLCGSFIGDTVTISGQGGVHYDEQLSNLGSSTGGFSIDAWQDGQTPYPLSP